MKPRNTQATSQAEPAAGSLNRRGFITRALIASAGAAVAAPAAQTGPAPGSGTGGAGDAAVDPSSKGTLPMGKIGKLTVSRLISGGNLISGWAHSRDLF